MVEGVKVTKCDILTNVLKRLYMSIVKNIQGDQILGEQREPITD